MRRALIGIATGIVTVVAAAGVFFTVNFPQAQGPRLDAAPDIVGVDTGGSYIWVVRSGTGAIVVDAGLDPDIVAVKAVLSEWGLTHEDVRGVLLTHAHSDHIMAVNAFPNAEIYVDAADATLLTQDRQAESGLVRFVAGLTAPPKPDKKPRMLHRNAPLTVDGRAFQTRHVPGHTLGSTAYILGSTLFSGDAVVASGDGVMVLPSFISEDHAQVIESLHKLAALDVSLMLDGHAGIQHDPTTKIAAFLRE